MLDVITFGEALVDLPALAPGSLEDAAAFEKVPAGAPANVAVAVARLGGAAGFVGKAGEDAFGRFLKRGFTRMGVDTSRFVLDPRVRTGLAFVSTQTSGEREFEFYFDPVTDLNLRSEELDRSYVGQTRVFHFGTLSLIGEPARSATFHAADIAAANGALLSLDPNLRLSLWPSEEEARAQMRLALARAHLVKLAEDELHFLYPVSDDEAVERLLGEFANIRLVAVTYGAGGSVACTRREQIMVRGFPAESVDTTGAGDAFLGSLLLYLARHTEGPATLDDVPREDLRAAVRAANAAGAITTARRGATAAMPTQAEVDALLSGARDDG